MAYNERDFQTALVCGLMSKGRELKGNKSPIAYLYNGVQLPPLPEVEYEYAVINWYSYNQCYALSLFESPNYFTAYGADFFGTDESGVPKAKVYFAKNGAWELSDITEWNFVVTKGDEDQLSDSALWANFNLNYSDGTIYVAATEPIPIYK